MAEISVPAEGTWSYEVRHDLEIEMMGFDPITVGPAAAQAAGAAASTSVGVQPALLLAAGCLSLLALAGVTARIVVFRHGRLDRARVQ